MDRMSHKAAKFVAVAHYFEPADNVGNPANSYMKSFAFEPSATIEEIFAAIWPTDEFVSLISRPPVRIEIMPDQNSVPPEPRSLLNQDSSVPF
ncbi:hypothetical protein [Ciceribacter thiooxidans]|uniref:Uncharacterized protein n=1 Tax=Ciceribacter thiooxidans TaxID=1969821 RepID=A0ABV7I399_9HYPH|nr:hypothetical protein [Ciceribacter thiooxidans]